MKAPAWKAMLAALNPSPVFQAVAIFAEEMAANDTDLIELNRQVQGEACHAAEISADCR